MTAVQPSVLVHRSNNFPSGIAPHGDCRLSVDEPTSESELAFGAVVELKQVLVVFSGTDERTINLNHDKSAFENLCIDIETNVRGDLL